jgi:hypothetical protein
MIGRYCVDFSFVANAGSVLALRRTSDCHKKKETHNSVGVS